MSTQEKTLHKPIRMSIHLWASKLKENAGEVRMYTFCMSTYFAHKPQNSIFEHNFEYEIALGLPFIICTPSPLQFTGIWIPNGI